MCVLIKVHTIKHNDLLLILHLGAVSPTGSWGDTATASLWEYVFSLWENVEVFAVQR